MTGRIADDGAVYEGTNWFNEGKREGRGHDAARVVAREIPAAKHGHLERREVAGIDIKDVRYDGYVSVTDQFGRNGRSTSRSAIRMKSVQQGDEADHHLLVRHESQRAKVSLEVLKFIQYHVLMPDVMERINLNVPSDVRLRLREMASQSGRSESEIARTLLVGALEGAWREAFYLQVAKDYGPKLRARDLTILRAFERLDG